MGMAVVELAYVETSWQTLVPAWVELSGCIWLCVSRTNAGWSIGGVCLRVDWTNEPSYAVLVRRQVGA